MVSFFYFGFFKTKLNIKNILGYNNTLKRIQAPYLFEFLKPKKEEKILDFGCGAGFFTSEIKKKGADTYAIDVIDNCICFDENSKIHYQKIRNINDISFPNNFFDKILVSELLMVIEDNKTLFKILKRKLKKNGKIFCLNAVVYEDIEKFFKRKSLLKTFQFLFPKMPCNYKEFCKEFFKMDNCKRRILPTPKEINSIFIINKFKKIEQKFICNGIGFSVENYFRLLYLISNFKFNYNNFFSFILLYMLNLIKKKNKSHLLTIATK